MEKSDKVLLCTLVEFRCSLQLNDQYSLYFCHQVIVIYIFKSITKSHRRLGFHHVRCAEHTVDNWNNNSFIHHTAELQYSVKIDVVAIISGNKVTIARMVLLYQREAAVLRQL